MGYIFQNKNLSNINLKSNLEMVIKLTLNLCFGINKLFLL